MGILPGIFCSCGVVIKSQLEIRKSTSNVKLMSDERFFKCSEILPHLVNKHTSRDILIKIRGTASGRMVSIQSQSQVSFNSRCANTAMTFPPGRNAGSGTATSKNGRVDEIGQCSRVTAKVLVLQNCSKP